MDNRLIELGRLVKQARAMKGKKEGTKVTQESFARQIGISRSYLADIERGAIEPSMSILTKMAQVCDLSLDFFRLQETGRTQWGMGLIPILGVVRAGEPIDAYENIIGYVNIPVRGGTDEYFGLSVVGDSMDLAGIKDGDVVIVRKQPDVENGQIAAVLIDNERATIKRIYKNGSYISLNPQSSNPEHQPRIIDPSVMPVCILGRVVKAVINL